MKTIKLNHITKIEGHAKLTVKIDKSKVKQVKLDIFEGARFFESIVKDRNYWEVPIMTARICGVCSVAHAVGSIMAVEDAFNVEVSKQTKQLREIMTLAEMLHSHLLHLYFMALPDYFGFDSAISMVAKHKSTVLNAVKLKALAGKMIQIIGGREIHPITMEVGGFSKLPEEKALRELAKEIKSAKKDILKVVALFSGLDFPELERNINYFALKGNNYAVINGDIFCSGNYCVKKEDYIENFKEYVKKGSTAKYVLFGDKPFYVGALARINTNEKFLSADARKFAFKSNNPYMNNFAQAVEVVHFFDRCVELLEGIHIKEEKPVNVKIKSGRGISWTEAPRGLLLHDYSFDAKGIVTDANIITPTGFNIKNIEGDIKLLIPTIMHKSRDEIVMDIEKLIRAYDPCISCSSHFLEVEWI